jgi:hypothetical protein
MIMFHLKITQPQSGFTNQIFALISGLIKAFKEGCKIVVVDEFLDDIRTTTKTPISQVIDLPRLNEFLKQYNMRVYDRTCTTLKVMTVRFGALDSFTDLTDVLVKSEHKLFVHQSTVFNEVKGDPCPRVYKKVLVKFTLNDDAFEAVYNEKLSDPIDVQLDGPYVSESGWINGFNDSMFDKILTNIPYQSLFNSDESATTRKVNVIHLRLEEDGIEHWSKMNRMAPEAFKSYLELKYIDIITKNLDKNDEFLILTNSFSNVVIDFLRGNGCTLNFVQKRFDAREKDAIVDLLAARKCNNVFVGNFNLKNLNGSTFSYYVAKLLGDGVAKIYIDLDRITDPAVFVPSTPTK